ncbi:uncharacterized protein LOC135152038 [Daucus carota subsp. sativus]|uniref:uncharacterized protein LOC135152038 n=1 Tax=Daucus carota subsp. sativus TaxID=79200 RepID=UPI003083B8EA
MPFGLLNAGATYQKMVNKMFMDQTRKTMEVYVDDMLVKSKEAYDHVTHLSEMFDILRDNRMKLNPQKCVFGVESGKFLGFIFNHRGIKANPAKIKALIEMRSPRNVKEEEEQAQQPVYYVSKRLLDAETRYSNMEKLAYALILASRKLRPYFQAHKIEVRTSFPLRQVLHKSEASRRVMKWAVELVQFDIEYKPRTSIKGQALADFIFEFPPTFEVERMECVPEPQSPIAIPENYSPWWNLYGDGAVNGNGVGAGIILVSTEGHKLQSSIHFDFKATNNDAEYEALIAGLKLALEMRVENMNVYSDSMQELIGKFREIKLEQLPRSGNADADALAKLGSQRDAHMLWVIPLEIKYQPSIPKIEVLDGEVDESDLWTTPIQEYIANRTLPIDKDEARKLRFKAAQYVIYDGILYKRGFNRPLLRCVAGIRCEYIMREVHEGICGNHSGGASLAHKILRQGYYWPTLYKDGHAFAKAGDSCQRFSNTNKNPAVPLKTLTSPWPFPVWGIDLIGELPKGKGGVKYAVVAVDYFTKWAEAEHLASITARKLVDFVYRAIVCRYGVPYKLISYNGKQFDSNEMINFYEHLSIKKGFSAVCHPQSNSQTEAVNKIIKHTLKAKLEEKKGCWPEELPMVLWSYNTTPRSTTSETPFTPTYGCEAMVPVEVGAGSFRRDNYDTENIEVNHRLYLDLIEEVRDTAQLKLDAYQQRTRKYFDKKVRDRPLKRETWFSGK